VEPAVAVCWYLAFAESFDAPVLGSRVTLLFASLWLVYMADRLLDVWRLPPAFAPRTERHRFVHRHWARLTGVWTVALVAAVTLAGFSLTASEWGGSLTVVGATLVYLRLVHGARSRWRLRERGAKELGVALVFSVGSTVFVWSSLFVDESTIGPSTMPTFALALLAFFGIALHNLVHLARVERHIDVHHDSPSIAWRGRSETLELGLSLGLISLASVNVILLLNQVTLPFVSLTTLLPVTLGAALGSLLLSLQERVLPELKGDAQHVLADVAVLIAGLPGLLMASPLLT
jgi:apolipoprotein N-acyltransferase